VIYEFEFLRGFRDGAKLATIMEARTAFEQWTRTLTDQERNSFVRAGYDVGRKMGENWLSNQPA
jgi:hypothetical protein